MFLQGAKRGNPEFNLRMRERMLHVIASEARQSHEKNETTKEGRVKRLLTR
jgi:hypothetical protein